jgi:naphthoate synthase
MATLRNWSTINVYEEIKFDFFEGIARITINRPRYRNAFTPDTTKEMCDAMTHCRENQETNI